MTTEPTSRFGGRFDELTVDETAHDISGLFVVGLRVLIGGMILFAGLGKLSEWPFDAAGYLANIDAASPVSGIYAAMAEIPALMELINVVIPVTQVLIGVALIAGGFVRLAAFGGTLQMLAFYLGGWSGDMLAAFDSTLIYAAVFLTVAALGAGRILGADAYIEQVSVGGQPLIERVPAVHYLLG